MSSRNNSNQSSSIQSLVKGTKRKNQVLGEINSNQITKKTKSKKFKNSKSNKFKQDENNEPRLPSTPISTLSDYPSSSSTTTTASAAASLSFNPLPNLNYSDSTKLWNSMLENDDLYKRNPNLFQSHPTLQPMMRSTLLDWLNEVCQAYNLTRQTFYLALDFFDRYLSITQNMPKQSLQLLGITCLYIAAKIEEIFPPKLKQFSFVCDGACDDEQILKKELVILNTLEWELHPITPICWLSAFVKIYKFKNLMNKENHHQHHSRPSSSLSPSSSSSSNKLKKLKQVNESFLLPDQQQDLFIRISHLIDLCSLDSGSLQFNYSVIAASAFFHFTDEEIVLQCTGKSMLEIQTCVKWMIPFAKAIKNNGFDFLQKFEFDQTAMIQAHTTNLDLLKDAQSIQAIENDDNQMLAAATTVAAHTILLDQSDNSSLIMSPTKMPLTPPPSGHI